MRAGEEIRALIGEGSWAALTAEERDFLAALTDDPEGRHYLDVVARAIDEGLSWVAFGSWDGLGISIDLEA